MECEISLCLFLKQYAISVWNLCLYNQSNTPTKSLAITKLWNLNFYYIMAICYKSVKRLKLGSCIFIFNNDYIIMVIQRILTLDYVTSMVVWIMQYYDSITYKQPKFGVFIIHWPYLHLSYYIAFQSYFDTYLYLEVLKNNTK